MFFFKYDVLRRIISDATVIYFICYSVYVAIRPLLIEQKKHISIPFQSSEKRILIKYIQLKKSKVVLENINNNYKKIISLLLFH
jgi:hypothetical protein